jgi:hypothetical protein
MQYDALDIDSNMMASGKLKTKFETGNKKTRRYRDQGGPSGSGRSLKEKIDDMERIIKEISNKISRKELDQVKNEHFPIKDFKRNPNPQNPPRQIKNEDQKIQAPFKRKNFIGGEDVDDEQLQKNLEIVDDFSETHANQENQNDPIWIMQEGEDPQKFQDKIANHQMLALKNNQIPKGLIPLERIFNPDDIPLKSTLQPQPEEVEDCNIVTKENPRLVKLSKYLSLEIKSKYVEFLRQYKDIFS